MSDDVIPVSTEDAEYQKLSQAVDAVIGGHWDKEREKERERCAHIVYALSMKKALELSPYSHVRIEILAFAKEIYGAIKYPEREKVSSHGAERL